jgi:pyruvate,orthophosphate dikinase
MQRVFTMNYEYWLSEKDPLAWFTEECGDICRGWQAGQLFNAISHKQLKNTLPPCKKLTLLPTPARP